MRRQPLDMHQLLPADAQRTGGIAMLNDKQSERVNKRRF